MAVVRKSPAKRRRGSAAETRTRLLEVARARFFGDSYDRVGIRDIAADAGVDAALVSRHFGSKEQLFAEAIVAAFDAQRTIVQADRRELGAHLARSLTQRDPNARRVKPDPLQLLFHAAGSPAASVMVADRFESEFVEPLSRWLGGGDAKLRASLFAAYIVGFVIMRRVLRLSAIKVSDSDEVVRLLGTALQACIDDKPETAPRPHRAAKKVRNRSADDLSR